MSNDTGLGISRSKDGWVLVSINASTGHENPLSTHDTRAEAIDAAAKELGSGYEYGVMFIDDIDPAPKPRGTIRGGAND